MIQIPTSANVHECRSAHIWQADDGIIYVVYKGDTANSIDDMIEHLEVIKSISQDEKAQIILDATRVQASNRQTRQYAAGPAYAAVVEAVAAIVSSPVTKVLANIFININRPRYPIRLFNDVDSAREWLKQFQKDTPTQSDCAS